MLIEARYISHTEFGSDYARSAYVLYHKSIAKTRADVQRIRDRAAKHLQNLRQTLIKRQERSYQRRSEAFNALMQQRLRTLKDQANRECLSLACRIAEEILKRELQHDTNFLQQKIDNMLSTLQGLQVHQIIVPPKMSDTVRQNVQTSRELNSTEVTEERELEVGTALINTSNGSVQINWREHLRRIESSLSTRSQPSYPR